MARLNAGLIARALAGNVEPGRYRDGGGLILNVKANSASWLWRYKLHGRPRDMGLGTLDVVGLSKARELVAQHKAALAATRADPIAQRQEQKAEAAASFTFDKVAAAYIAENEPGWKNDKHKAQWRSTLATYCSPRIGGKAVREITTEDVLAILRPLWQRAPETASRVRGRIETVLDYAKAHGWRDGENVARWRGHLAMVLPKKSKVPNGEVRHHPACIVDHAPTLFARLRKLARLGDSTAPGNAAQAVMFAMLTAARPGEVQNACWSEVDRASEVWTVPAERMKGNRPHRVPLNGEALAILDDMAKRRDPDSDFVFPGGKRGAPLSLTSMAKALRVGMGKDLKTDCGDAATVHGTARSTFDDWSHEKTSYASRLVDKALAHGEKNQSIAAYRRSELLDGRRPLMRDWGRFLNAR